MKNKNVFPKICPHIRPAVQELKLQKAVASRETGRANAARKVHTLRLWSTQRETLTGSMLKSRRRYNYS